MEGIGKARFLGIEFKAEDIVIAFRNIQFNGVQMSDFVGGKSSQLPETI